MRKYVLIVSIFLISSVTITSGRTFHGAAMAPNTLKGWVVASDTGLVLHTTDCGLTWYNQSFLTPRYFWDVFFLNDQKGWIAGNEGFVFYTPNGGQRWYRQAMGLSYNTNKIYFLNDTCGWAACDMAVTGRTVKGNDTIYNFYNWQSIYLPYPPFYYDTCDIQSISFINYSNGWFCAGRFPYYAPWAYETCFTRGQGHIATSIDSGLNWQLLLRDTINDFFDIKMLDSLNGFVAGGNDRTMSAVIMKTQDGGLNWLPLSLPAQAKFLRSLKIIGTNKIWAVGYRGTILHSNNGGLNWTLQTCPIDTTLYDVDFGDTLHGLIAGDGCVLYTHNGGNTWHIANLGIEEEIGVASSNYAKTMGIRVYPNPAKSYLTVQFPLTTNHIKIFDISGKLTKEIATPSNRNDNDIRVSLNGIKNGVYFVCIETQSKPIIQRLVVIR